MQRINVVSLFPEMFGAIKDYGMTRRAIDDRKLQLGLVNPRDFVMDNYRRVDDRPYGGGPGMVMMAEPVNAAIEEARKDMAHDVKVIYLSPQGHRLNHRRVRELVEGPDLVLLAGRYEGIDERVLERQVDEELSIGDYVLAGGELAAMVLIEAMVRWLPGVLGNAESASQDSFTDDLLDCRHYTRPEVWRKMPVPEVLLGGNHEAIRKWRARDALVRTRLKRPDLILSKVHDVKETAPTEHIEHEPTKSE